MHLTTPLFFGERRVFSDSFDVVCSAFRKTLVKHEISGTPIQLQDSIPVYNNLTCLVHDFQNGQNLHALSNQKTETTEMPYP